MQWILLSCGTKVWFVHPNIHLILRTANAMNKPVKLSKLLPKKKKSWLATFWNTYLTEGAWTKWFVGWDGSLMTVLALGIRCPSLTMAKTGSSQLTVLDTGLQTCSNWTLLFSYSPIQIKTPKKWATQSELSELPWEMKPLLTFLKYGWNVNVTCQIAWDNRA